MNWKWMHFFSQGLDRIYPLPSEFLGPRILILGPLRLSLSTWSGNSQTYFSHYFLTCVSAWYLKGLCCSRAIPDTLPPLLSASAHISPAPQGLLWTRSPQNPGNMKAYKSGPLLWCIISTTWNIFLQMFVLLLQPGQRLSSLDSSFLRARPFIAIFVFPQPAALNHPLSPLQRA